MNPTKLAIACFAAALAITPSLTMGQTFESLSSRRVHNKKPTQQKIVTKHRNRKGSKTFTKVPVTKPKQNQPIIFRPNLVDPAIVRLTAEAQARAAAQRQAANPRFGSPVFGPTAGNGVVRRSTTQPAKTETLVPSKATPSPVRPVIIKSPFAKFNDDVEPKLEEPPKVKGSKSIQNPFVSDNPPKRGWQHPSE